MNPVHFILNFVKLIVLRQRDKLENMLRELISERSKIADCMTWCIDHAEAADEVHIHMTYLHYIMITVYWL